MFVSGSAKQYIDQTASDETTITGMATGTDSTTKLDWMQLSTNYAQENRFFKGFLFVLPVSILIWVAIIWGTNTLIF